MPVRRNRLCGGYVYHVLNRGSRRGLLFETPGDYSSFVGLMGEAQLKFPIRILAYCLMPNHFHFVLWPTNDSDISRYMGWLTLTHSKRWHFGKETNGQGAVYQGRFKAIPVQTDGHFLTVCRYVERNALRARLVGRAEDWRWCSLSQRARDDARLRLDAWPLSIPSRWGELVNASTSEAADHSVHQAVSANRPFGQLKWAEREGLAPTPKRAGRPKKQKSTPGVGFL